MIVLMLGNAKLHLAVIQTDISRDAANSQFRHVHVYQKIVRVEVNDFSLRILFYALIIKFEAFVIIVILYTPYFLNC